MNLVPVGQDQEGQMILVEQVPSGLTALVCPVCRTRLVAKKGDEVQHHFAHHGDSPSGVSCGESWLHAQAVRAASRPFNIKGRPRKMLIDNTGPWQVQAAKSEHPTKRKKRRLDVLLTMARYEFTEHLNIEIHVGHPKDRAFCVDAHEMGLHSLEIDISWKDVLQRRHLMRTAPDQYRTIQDCIAALCNAPPRENIRWLAWPITRTQAPGWPVSEHCVAKTLSRTGSAPRESEEKPWWI